MMNVESHVVTICSNHPYRCALRNHYGAGRALVTTRWSTYSRWVLGPPEIPRLNVSWTEFRRRIKLLRKLNPDQLPRWTPSSQNICLALFRPGVFSLTQNST